MFYVLSSHRPYLILFHLSVIYADYSEALTTLLRYPTSNPPLSITLLLSQSVLLANSALSPTLGVSLVMENQAVLDIPANPPPPSSEEERPKRRMHSEKDQARVGSRLTLARNFDFGGAVGAAQQAAAGIGIHDLAKGLMEKGQALGIDKNLLGRVAEMRVSNNVSFLGGFL